MNADYTLKNTKDCSIEELFARCILRADDAHYFTMLELGEKFEPHISDRAVRQKMIDKKLIFEVRKEKREGEIEGRLLDYAPSAEAMRENLCWLKSVEKTNAWGESFRHFDMCWLETVLLQLDGFDRPARGIQYE